MSLNNKLKRIYFVSQYDNEVHNIGDYDHILEDENNALIGKWVYDGDSKHKDTLRVEEEVNLWTIEDVCEFYKIATGE